MPLYFRVESFEKVFEKQQAVIAAMIKFAQKTSPPAADILNLVVKRSTSFLKQDMGPFTPQSATWKNKAVAHLTMVGALGRKKTVKRGLKALCEDVRHPSEEVDKDPQLEYVYNLIQKCALVLHEKFGFQEQDLRNLGWDPDLKGLRGQR